MHGDERGQLASQAAAAASGAPGQKKAARSVWVQDSHAVGGGEHGAGGHAQRVELLLDVGELHRRGGGGLNRRRGRVGCWLPTAAAARRALTPASAGKYTLPATLCHPSQWAPPSLARSLACLLRVLVEIRELIVLLHNRGHRVLRRRTCGERQQRQHQGRPHD